MFKQLFSGFKRNEPVPDRVALQEAIVKSVAGDITDLPDGEWEGREWVYLAVNHEVLVEEGRRSSSQTSVLAHLPDGELEGLSFRLSPQSKEAILALRDAMADEVQGPWTILDLTVERSGKYDFKFSYDPPPRLNGNLLHSPLTGLLDRYLRQRAERPLP
ncbi:hypothetical protein SAMN05216456_1426 [Devosia crocina]|uniref:Uncharacterized protein n=1 Tax=Devosia crocina TaxID=429728 RepID=A0A1I7NAK1_9HYPH|nr:hypothetical protein [Devosia crocina]SFV31690.1 hypothetical protein SAMN05216456_1426 [Devosia crocina]